MFDIQPEVSSQDAVEVLLEVEPVLGFEPPASTIKKGGYTNCDDFIEHLVPELESRFNKATRNTTTGRK